MIHKLLKILPVTLFFYPSVKGQNYTFEDTTVPSAWTATQGTLSLSGEHYKDGSQSLCWQTSGISVLEVAPSSFVANTSNSAYLQIYSPSNTNDTLKVEFLYYNSARKTAWYLLNYKGWREFNRAYTEYASTLSSTIHKIRFTLFPTSGSTRKIYFDQVNFNQATESKRYAGPQWTLDKNYLTSTKTLLDLALNIRDIPITTPTSEELAGLTQLRNTLQRTPTGTASQILEAKNYVQSLNITRNSDGSVKGNVINTTASALTAEQMTAYWKRAEYLAAGGLNDPSTLQIFRNYLDYLLDQGLGEGVNFLVPTNDYTNARTIPESIINVLSACTSDQKNEVLKLAAWLSYYGSLYNPEDTWASMLNSDLIYLFLQHQTAIALALPDNAIAVRDLKGLKRYLERNTEYIPGGYDILKPDGTGFHHNSHYNNYMYSYKTWVEYLYYLKGTVYRISPEAYARMKKAIITIYTMATLDSGDTRYYANAFSGRNPFSSGMQLQFTKSLFEKLILVGGDCLGTAIDEELAAAYNYFFSSSKYAVTPVKYEGFYAYNYSPAAIFRKDNWVATMRSPTTKFFGAEIYNNENRFGRYQSNGTLEITYSGTLANSGYPTNGTGGGWDWNVVPGATTVNFTSWQEMMPYQSQTGRFDQYTKTKNFAGALSWKDGGLFSADFDQIDTWSSTAFTPTNLTFKKSMFAFGNMIISLGTNISSSGSYASNRTTTTNLFQNIISETSGNLKLNGNVVSQPANLSVSTASANWIVTPQGTGYIIPTGNDTLEIRYGSQSTPVETGADYASPTTSSVAAKAWLNHGVKPSAKQYRWIVIPAAKSINMDSLTTLLSGENNSVYQVHAQTNSVHAVEYKPENITAYSFFGAVSNLNFGLVKAASSENLLMVKYLPDSNYYHLNICNPNLNPVANTLYGWNATASQTTLTLNGGWSLVEPVENVQIFPPDNGHTQVMITMSEGLPVEFDIKQAGDTNGLSRNVNQEWYISRHQGCELSIRFNEPQQIPVLISIYNLQGRLLLNRKLYITNNQDEVSINIPIEGLCLCKVTDAKKSKTIKIYNQK